MAPQRVRTHTAHPHEERHVRPGYHCTGCGYGVATAAPPCVCPMCRAEHWTATRRGASEALGVRRIGGSTFVLTPPAVLDAEAGVLLIETIADLATTQPRVVVDLTGVDVGDRSTAARLLLRLEALAHCSGGRLLAVRADSSASGVEIHRFDLVGREAPEVVDHELEPAASPPATATG